jgi:hypothetical protein
MMVNLLQLKLVKVFGFSNKGFAPFSAKFVDSITVFIINANLLLASPDSL